LKKLLFLIVVGGACYGIYRWLEDYSGGVLDKAAKEAGGGALTRGRELADRAAGKIAGANVEMVKQAVSRFKEVNGRNPSSLEETVDKGFLESVPQGVSYDPATGEVTAAQ
jgi:hypothetical protein